MPDNHIIKMLDEKPFDRLSDGDIESAESHIAKCAECKSAYDAAQVAGSLIRARASKIVDPEPFFKTRVMAAIRERHLTPEEPALARMWRAAGALISTMALLLVILSGLTIFNTPPQGSTQVVAASQNLYSPEYVVLDPNDLDNEVVANDQVLVTMYDLEDGDGQ